MIIMVSDGKGGMLVNIVNTFVQIMEVMQYEFRTKETTIGRYKRIDKVRTL